MDEKLQIIRKIVKKHDLVAHKISENIDLSTNTISKIIKNDNNLPKPKSINILFRYLTKTYIDNKDSQIKEYDFTDLKIRTAEEKPDNYNVLKDSDKIDIILKTIVKLKEENAEFKEILSKIIDKS